MTILTIADLTTTTLDGVGVFDTLMRANKAHLEAEFSKDRIKGSEYATVYLGSLETVMRSSMEFLLQKQKIGLEADLLAQQILLAQVAVTKANAELAIIQASLPKVAAEIAHVQAQTALTTQQTANAVAELAILQANALKIPAEIAHIQAQTAVSVQQRLNLIDDVTTNAVQRTKLTQETENLATQKLQIEAQTSMTVQQKLNLVSDNLGIIAKTAMTAQQTTNLVSENLSIVAKTAMTTQQKLNLVSDNLSIVAKTAMTTQQIANLVAEALNIPKTGEVLVATKCKLQAEYDVLLSDVLKTNQEVLLLTQKVVTEKAQTMSMGVDADSIIGKQKFLYGAQADGFKRDAEQKAAKIVIDTWNVKRTTNDAEPAIVSDSAITGAVSKMLAGIGA